MENAKSGLFVTLFDKETLNLYLNKGVYSFHMPPIYKGFPSSQSRHFAALADYATTRRDTHIFFFLQRTIIYGGQIINSKSHGAFYLNGPYSPMGRVSNADVYWDESQRSIYNSTDKKGIFTRPNLANENQREIKVCQPYLLLFKDKIGLKGNAIESDQLYFELGDYPYPLPSNSIQGMSFCTLTPRETEITLKLLKNESKKRELYRLNSNDNVEFEGDPLPYNPDYDIKTLNDAVSESHLEASIIANPNLLPEEMKLQKEYTICRQVPISPFKPSQMDRADICYYSEENQIAEGTIPNVIIELKNNKAGAGEARQIKRYIEWLHKRLGDKAKEINFYLLAPSFTSTISRYIPENFRDQVKIIKFDGSVINYY